MDLAATQHPVATAPAPAAVTPPRVPAAGPAVAPPSAVEPSAAGRHGAWATGHGRLVDQLRALAAHQAARHVAAGGVAHVPGTDPPKLVAVPIGSPALVLTVELPEEPRPREALAPPRLLPPQAEREPEVPAAPGTDAPEDPPEARRDAGRAAT